MAAKYRLRNIRSGVEYILAKPSILMGRSESCNIPIEKGHPSREHARLIQRREGLFVEDLHSTNGTYVNNRRIEEATNIEPGDVLTLGEESFVLVSELNPDMTIVAGKLTPKANDSASILIAEDDDDESTQIREAFPLPKGWALGKEDDYFTKSSTKGSRREMNRLISKVAAKNDAIYTAALVFFITDAEPEVRGISLEQGKNSWLIGRGAQCDLVIDDPCISECHARLDYQDGKWILRDNKSTNGIRSDNRLCQELPLRDGLEFIFGRLEAIFRVVKLV